jgi:DNA-binding response OmpR family regulator
VLIVEDDPDSRMMLHTLLQLFGMQTHSAGTAREGLVLARQERPCVILLDLMLPDLDGQAFRRQQQRDPDVAGIPVIVVSAHPRAKTIAAEIGASGCVGKPIDFDALLANISEVCGIDDPKRD